MVHRQLRRPQHTRKRPRDEAAFLPPRPTRHVSLEWYPAPSGMPAPSMPALPPDPAARLAEQAPAALLGLLRGFEAADAQGLARLAPPHILAGLVTVPLRLVVLLHAEDRGLYARAQPHRPRPPPARAQRPAAGRLGDPARSLPARARVPRRQPAPSTPHVTHSC